MSHEQRTPRRTRAGLALLLVAAALVVAACSGDDGEDVARSWRVLPASPLSGRFFSAVRWTGREMVIWGGGTCSGDFCNSALAVPLADGAAYDPAANVWRPIAESPLRPRLRAMTAWTGKELLVWGGNAEREGLADGAAYDPATDRWRPLAQSPLAPREAPATAWTGKEVLFWGSGDNRQSHNDGAAYDPDADRWRMLPESPLQPRRAFATAWTGSELLIWGGGPDNSLVFYGSGAAYAPANDRWRDIPAWNSRFGPVSAWTGTELIVWGGIYAPAKIEVLADGARLRVDATG